MKAAVVLAGCGVMDGAEIHEAVMTLYAIDSNGRHVPVVCTQRDAAPCHQPHYRRGNEGVAQCAD
ncbi:MAG: hypothetical protein MZV63_68420 [Marinilabiliales bacterium]|nr:hypothetical protein [Marinilabiliales bacterium]